MGAVRSGVGVRGDIGGSGYHPEDVVSPTPLLRTGRAPGGLNAAGRVLLDEVLRRDGARLSELAGVLADCFGIPEEVALEDVASFVQRAQIAGLLSYHRRAGRLSVGVRLVVNVLLLPVRGVVLLPSVQRRYHPFTVGRMVASTVSAQVRLGLVVLVLAMLPLSLVDGLWSRAGGSVLLGLAIGTVGGLVVLGVVHEAAHAVASTAFGTAPHAVYRQGLRTGLQRVRLTPAKDALVAVAGPLVGAAVGCGLVALALVVDSASPTGVSRSAILGACIATGIQVACLVPPAADGRILLACMRGRSAGRA